MITINIHYRGRNRKSKYDQILLNCLEILKILLDLSGIVVGSKQFLIIFVIIDIAPTTPRI